VKAALREGLNASTEEMPVKVNSKIKFSRKEMLIFYFSRLI
jgi:hypothetical protein